MRLPTFPTKTTIAFFTALFAAVVFAFYGETASAIEKSTVMVSMRDGIKLATDIYLPVKDKKLTVILTRTPYGREMWGQAVAPLFMGKRFAVVSQDTRGRYGSEGVASSFLDDANDGYDTVEWIAQQPWSNGKIATMGVSAMGITQYMMDKTAPPHLTCQLVIAASPNLYRHGAYQGGGFLRSLVLGWLSGSDFPPEVIELMMNNINYNDVWKETDLTPDINKVDVPILHMGGWYDIFLQGNIEAFQDIESKGGPNAKGKQRLIIGPWTHMGFAGLMGTRQGDLDYPDNSKYDILTKAGAWLQECTSGADRGFFRSPAVKYYTMGASDEPGAPGNVWKTAASWPPPSQPTPFYFHTDLTMSDAQPGIGGAALDFIADPASPTPTLGGANLLLDAGPRDQRPIESRNDVLTFSTPVLEQPIEVTGPITATIYLKTDVVDTDISVRLTDVYPDGRSMLVTDGIIRASHRESVKYTKPLEPGKTYKLTVDLWATSLIFNKGHRIRVIVSGSNFPRFDINLNNGTFFQIDKDEIKNALKTNMNTYIHKPDVSPDAKIAHNTIFLNAEYPSHIMLPVVK